MSTATEAKQTELSRARDEVQELEKTSAELGARIEIDRLELAALRRSQQPQNIGVDVDLDALSQDIAKANALEARILGDQQRRRDLDREIELARSRQAAFQIERVRLVEDVARYELELGERGQAARFEREAKDLLNRAQTLRGAAEAQLQKAKARLSAIGE